MSRIDLKKRDPAKNMQRFYAMHIRIYHQDRTGARYGRRDYRKKHIPVNNAKAGIQDC